MDKGELLSLKEKDSKENAKRRAPCERRPLFRKNAKQRHKRRSFAGVLATHEARTVANAHTQKMRARARYRARLACFARWERVTELPEEITLLPVAERLTEPFCYASLYLKRRCLPGRTHNAKTAAMANKQKTRKKQMG